MSEQQTPPGNDGKSATEVSCPMCDNHETGDLVARLPSGNVRLVNHADRPGYCILQYRRHAVEIMDLSAEERFAFIEDLAAVERAVCRAFAPAKLNVLQLGNEVRHLHVHIVPRYPDEPDRGGPPSLSAADRRPMPPHEFTETLEKLRAELSAH